MHTTDATCIVTLFEMNDIAVTSGKMFYRLLSVPGTSAYDELPDLVPL